MIKVISCKFNVDTASVELRFSDGSAMGIYTPGIDATLDITMKQQAEVDWLIYNKPWEYAALVLSGELEQYAKDMAGSHALEA